MPTAMRNAACNSIWRDMIKVSSAMDVKIPFTIASDIIADVGQAIPLNWKNAIAPKSPLEQPIIHHIVLYDACPNLEISVQFVVRIVSIAAIKMALCLCRFSLYKASSN
jgi:hypothetical protein